jgi:hypothetical protein
MKHIAMASAVEGENNYRSASTSVLNVIVFLTVCGILHCRKRSESLMYPLEASWYTRF